MNIIILPIIVDSAYLPTTASESRNPTKFNVQSVDLTKFEPVNISPGMSNHTVYCWEATANRQLFSLKTREKAEILCQN